ncbi:hypothetical protein ACOTF2_07235 [Achromobacter xylosoxidans]
MTSVAQVPKKSTVALRIPPDARDWLAREAKAACRTVSGQVLFMIEQARSQKAEARQ